MTEIKLPEELEEQAILHALGILDPSDRRAFMVRLQGESQLLRQAATEYQAVTDALASAVVPVAPPEFLRERLASRVALEAARELESFELTANTVALNTAPLKPRDSLRERLLSCIESQTKVSVDLRDRAHTLVKTPVPTAEARVGERGAPPAQEADSLLTWLRSCWSSVLNFLRTLQIRSVTPRPSRDGLTFVKASEGTWLKVAPGVIAKLLSYDSISCRVTSLVRIDPGTTYAPHRHAAAEELYVLEGGCFCGGRELVVGDYHRAEAGTEHHDTSSDDGCLLLVVSSPQNEMLG